MSRNQMNRFSLNPNIHIQRSRFKRDSSVKTSFNVGELIPFYVDEVLPGDTHNITTSKIVRLQTLMTPIMDDLFLDTYYFFVPNRLTWDHWKEFCGENSQSPWIPQTEYTVPQVTAPSGGYDVGTIADYMGIPTGVAGLTVNALPFRAYGLIVNDWFRDENLLDPVMVDTGDSNVTGSNGSDYITDLVLGGKPFKAAKYHDYFTSALPSPQKGPDVTIGLTGDADIFGTGKTLTLFDGTTPYGTAPNSAGGRYDLAAYPDSYNVALGTNNVGDQLSQRGLLGLPTKDSGFDSNIYADMSSLSATTINQLRMAFQIQKLYEKDARGGTRYIEVLKEHFGVTSPDARLQRPEYLGGNRKQLGINQVVQQSETGDTPQGNTSGISVTVDTNKDFTHSFVEHGFIIGLAVVRYNHTYQQGLERMWSRQGRFDYYWPVLANIGEQAIKNKEIFAQGTSVDNEVFGYQEAWADYRYKVSRVSGEMRSQYAQSLDVWHLADYYDTLPTLSPGWITEDKATVNRVIAVSDELSNQLFGDFYIQNHTTRPMPMYSIPGLIDHH